VSPVRYELGFYFPEDAILHSHRLEHLKPYIIEISLQDPQYISDTISVQSELVETVS
jgi:hypothetical protein